MFLQTIHAVQSTAYDNKIHGKAIPKKINILKDDMIVRLTSPFTAKQADKTTITIPMGSIGTVKSQSAHGIFLSTAAAISTTHHNLNIGNTLLATTPWSEDKNMLKSVLVSVDTVRDGTMGFTTGRRRRR